MAYSGDPSTDGLDAVRFWAQDTGATGLLSDAEILYLITFTGLDPAVAPIEAAAVVADRIAAKYAGEVSINSDGVSYSGDQLQQKYSTLATELRKSAVRMFGEASGPYVGGPGSRNFGIAMHDNPEGYRQQELSAQLENWTGDWDSRIGGW